MKISIIIPCYNEDILLQRVIDKLLKVNLPLEREIIIVDDGSDTIQSKFINTEIKNGLVKFFRLNSNQGKAIAIRIGLKFASGNIILIQDADFEYDPVDIPNLISPIIEKKTNVVYGTRFKATKIKMAKFHYYGNRFLTRITNFLYNSNLTDMETGYKVFTRELINILELTSREFEFEPEITSKIIQKGYKILEVPIRYSYRTKYYSKITIIDGFDSFLILLKNRLFSNSKMFMYLYKIFKIYLKKKLNAVLFRIKLFLSYIAKYNNTTTKST